MATNSANLVTTRLKAIIQPTSANQFVRTDGVFATLPGQGGIVTGIALGDVAGRWVGDHVEPGVSLGHSDPQAYHAIRALSCVGNPVEVLGGPAGGAHGIVTGKHGAVLAMFAPDVLVRLTPGDAIAIDAQGIGLADPEFPDVTFQSCSPAFYEAMAKPVAGRLKVSVAAVLPSIAAAAGIGMPAAMFNMDLHTSSAPVAEMAKGLRFGDLVAVMDQDHRYGRQHRKGWAMVGIVSHGTATAGGHGLGLMTLLTAPADRFVFETGGAANLAGLLPMPWGRA